MASGGANDDGSAIATAVDRRICANFAVIYAGAALAIDFKILPWGKKSTRAAIAKCMNAAFATLRKSFNPQSAATPSIRDISKTLKNDISRLNLVAVQKGKHCSAKEATKRQGADGFRTGPKILIKPKGWKGINDANRHLLIQHKVLETQRGDAATIDRKIAGIPGKRRYYMINRSVLKQTAKGSALA